MKRAPSGDDMIGGQAILSKSKDNLLECNFDQSLLTLFTEVHYWEKFMGDFAIPYVAHDICNQREKVGGPVCGITLPVVQWVVPRRSIKDRVESSQSKTPFGLTPWPGGHLWTAIGNGHSRLPLERVESAHFVPSRAA